MTKQKRTRYQLIGLICLSLIIAAGTYGFARAEASGTSGLLEIGYGVQSAYQVTKINYLLDERNPTDFLAVSFELDQTPVSIQAGISESKGGQVIWADGCDLNGSQWTCWFAGSHDVRLANWLHID